MKKSYTDLAALRNRIRNMVTDECRVAGIAEPEVTVTIGEPEGTSRAVRIEVRDVSSTPRVEQLDDWQNN